MKLRARRWSLLLLALPVVAIVLFASAALWAPHLKQRLVQQANARLIGYTVKVESLSVHPWNMELILQNISLQQNAHPDPAVARIPHLDVGLQWLPLLRGRIVAKSHVRAPTVNIDVAQLQTELHSDIDFRKRGWQRLLELYPLEVNEVSITDATITYTVANSERPLQLQQASLEIHNIRRVTDRDQRYPSPVKVAARVFNSGPASFSGAADFVRFARPAYRGQLSVAGVPLDTLGPILKGYPLKIDGGMLAAQGEIQSDMAGTAAHLSQVRITDIRVDYLGGSDPAVVDAGRRAVRAATRAARDPTLKLDLDDLQVSGEFSYVNLRRQPRYRLYLRNSTLSVHHAANHTGPEATVAFSGRLMGSGQTTVRGVFRPGQPKPDFALDTRVTNTDLTQMNDMLRAHLHLDVAQGHLSVYSEVLVHDGKISGYVKPLFEDVKIYGPEDANENIFRKLYERIADGVRTMLEGHHQHAVATVADLSGTVSDPDTSTLQVLGSLLRNAFVKAIVPGFEQRFRKAPARAAAPPRVGTLPRLSEPADKVTLLEPIDAPAPPRKTYAW